MSQTSSYIYINFYYHYSYRADILLFKDKDFNTFKQSYYKGIQQEQQENLFSLSCPGVVFSLSSNHREVKELCQKLKEKGLVTYESELLKHLSPRELYLTGSLEWEWENEQNYISFDILTEKISSCKSLEKSEKCQDFIRNLKEFADSNEWN